MGTQNLLTRYGRAMIESAVARGFDLAELCRGPDIDVAALCSDEPSINPAVFGHLNVAIKTALNDDFCGFTEHPCKAGSFVLIIRSMLRSQSLGDALRHAFSIYSYITDDIRFRLTEDNEVATISLTLARPELDSFHYLHEWWLRLWPRTAVYLIGEEIPILGVEFPYEPVDPIEEYAEAFFGPCLFGQLETRVRFPSSFLGRRIVRNVAEFDKRDLEAPFNLSPPPGIRQSWRTLIKMKLTEFLARNERMLSIEELAEEFHMSSKTLRRRLDAEGISFRELKEEIRREMVLKWLAEPDIPIGEISLRAGFAERNGLVRAVRSWVGFSPKEYRDLMIGPWPSQLSGPGEFRRSAH
jgi:AraC-like DNA-binding protein